jgi:hypothetical protein
MVPNDDAANSGAEARPLAPDERKLSELTELLIDPQQSGFGSRRISLCEVRIDSQ